MQAAFQNHLLANRYFTAFEVPSTHDSNHSSFDHSNPNVPIILFQALYCGRRIAIIRESSGAVKAIMMLAGNMYATLQIIGLPTTLSLEAIENAKSSIAHSRIGLNGRTISVHISLKGGMMPARKASTEGSMHMQSPNAHSISVEKLPTDLDIANTASQVVYNLDNLHRELYIHLFRYLTPQDVSAISTVSLALKTWARMCATQLDFTTLNINYRDNSNHNWKRYEALLLDGLKAWSISRYAVTSLNFEKCDQLNSCILKFALDTFSNIHALSLKRCSDISSDTLSILEGMTQLTSLDLCNPPGHSPGNYINFKNETIFYIRNLTNLTFLSLEGLCQITDSGCAYLENLIHLQHLNLNMLYKLTDTGLQYIQNLLNLEFLDLSGCHSITDAGLGYLKNLINLIHLNLEGHDFVPRGTLLFSKYTNMGIAHLQNLKKLKYLNLENCNTIAESGGLANLRGCTQLEYLNLTKCKKVADASLAHLNNLISLKSLIIGNLSDDSHITDAGIAHLKQLTHLTELDLSNCYEITNNAIVNLKNFTNLSVLNLTDCRQLTDECLQYLKRCVHLQSLNLERLQFRNSTSELLDLKLSGFENLTELQDLNFSYCYELTDDVLRGFQSLIHLQTLDLTYCKKLVGSGFICLQSSEKLQRINLYGCESLTDEALVYFQGLKSLKSLHLNECHSITGAGLAYIEKLTNIESFGILKCEGITNQGFQNLKGPRSITSMKIDNLKNITDFIYLKNFDNLRILSVNNCPNLKNSFIEQVESIPTLEILNIYASSKFNYDQLLNLRNSKSLKSLHIRKCKDFNEQEKAEFKTYWSERFRISYHV